MRLAKLIAVYTILGAVLTITAAWVTTRTPYTRTGDRQRISHRWFTPVEQCPDCEVKASQFNYGFGRRLVIVLSPAGPGLPRTYSGQLHGWPLPAMHSWTVSHDHHLSPIARGLPSPLPPVSTFPNRLPLLPYWPGFIADMLIYAAAAWVLITIPRTARKTIRARRGRCPACGYQLTDLTTCPECGESSRASGAGVSPAHD